MKVKLFYTNLHTHIERHDFKRLPPDPQVLPPLRPPLLLVVGRVGPVLEADRDQDAGDGLARVGAALGGQGGQRGGRQVGGGGGGERQGKEEGGENEGLHSTADSALKDKKRSFFRNIVLDEIRSYS